MEATTRGVINPGISATHSILLPKWAKNPSAFLRNEVSVEAASTTGLFKKVFHPLIRIKGSCICWSVSITKLTRIKGESRCCSQLILSFVFSKRRSIQASTGSIAKISSGFFTHFSLIASSNGQDSNSSFCSSLASSNTVIDYFLQRKCIKLYSLCHFLLYKNG